jgi:hypothetical protein
MLSPTRAMKQPCDETSARQCAVTTALMTAWFPAPAHSRGVTEQHASSTTVASGAEPFTTTRDPPSHVPAPKTSLLTAVAVRP